MSFLSIILLAVLSSFIVHPLPKAILQKEQSLSHFFSVVFAQEDTPTPTPTQDSSEPTPTSTPSSETPTTAPIDSPTPQPSTEPSTTTTQGVPADATPSDQVIQQDVSSDTGSDSLLNQANTESQQEDQKNSNQQVKNENESTSNAQSSGVIVPESDLPTIQASNIVLNSSDIIGGPAEEVNQQHQDEAQRQDDALSQAQTPSAQALLSLDFARDTVKDIERQVRSNDFATMTFQIQRLDNHIDTLLENATKSHSSTLLRQAKTFCRQADILLKTEQLVVPEEAEQDFAIARAKCFEAAQ